MALLRAIACLVCSLSAISVLAQELEPRSYTNVPVGETFVVLGVTRSEGELTPNPSSPLQDTELTIDAMLVGAAHTFSLAGDSAKIDAAAARTCYEGSATFQGEFVEDRRCEYFDPRVRLTWNFYGAPALPLQDFAVWDPGLVVGASVQVNMPFGSYTSKQLINAGLGRWMIRPGIGMSFRTGRWHYDVSASVKIFEDNDEFFGTNYLEQDPLYGVQFHLVRYFVKGRWLSLDGNFYRGGETTVNGVKSDDLQENSRWGVTYSQPLNTRHSIKLYASTGVVTRVGGDFDTFGLGWQYRF